MNSIESLVLSFLRRHLDVSRPLLLALSGGSDSLALLHLAIEAQKTIPFSLHIAHVDHRWRQESSWEASELKKLADSLSLPFHLKVLNPQEIRGNREAAGREERQRFFREVCEATDAQAVLVAHHADDQAETMLRRVLEGHSFPYLHGIEEITEIQGLILWRPLLACAKADLIAWLQDRSLVPFEDVTNFDPRYLRGRFRTQILPDLSKQFGKGIGQALCRLAKEGQQLRRFLEDHVSRYQEGLRHGPLGWILSLDEAILTQPYALDYLVRRTLENQGLSVSRSVSGAVVQLLLRRAANKQVIAAQKRLYVDRGKLFVVPLNAEPAPTNVRPLEPGAFSYGAWQVEVSLASSESPAPCSHWMDAFLGRCQVTCPEGSYALAAARNQATYRGHSSLRKWWTDHKVPAFLAHHVPVLMKDTQVVHEFLTGRQLLKRPSTPHWVVTLQHQTNGRPPSAPEWLDPLASSKQVCPL